MALIIYPTADADSFISVADATTVIATYTLDSASWTALTLSEQEVYLRISYRDIVNHTDILDTDTNLTAIPDCIPEAQALMASWDVRNGLSVEAATDETGSIKKNKVGSIEQEFYDVATTRYDTNRTINRVPTSVVPCLEDFGYEFTPSIAGLTQLTLGKS